MTWKYASQTGRLVHAQAGPVSQFVWASIAIKTFGTKKIEELKSARECPRFYLPTLEMYDFLSCPVFQVVIF